MVPFVTGKSWLTYPESLTAPVVPTLLSGHARLLRALDAAGALAPWAQQALQAVFVVVLSRIDGRLGLQPEQEADWASTMARRMRAMLRHVLQARVKSPRVPWLVALGVFAGVDKRQRRLEDLGLLVKSDEQDDGAQVEAGCSAQGEPSSAADEHGDAEALWAASDFERDDHADEVEGDAGSGGEDGVAARAEVHSSEGGTAHDEEVQGRAAGSGQASPHDVSAGLEPRVGFDVDLGLAWRLRADGKGKEYTGLFVDMAPQDNLVAVFGEHGQWPSRRGRTSSTSGLRGR